jgi:hypothetical protein
MTTAETDFGPWSVEPTLRKGVYNDNDVRQLQELLRVFVDPNLDVDGDFGDDTEAAVLSFQTARGFPATGVVEEATWRALLEDPVSPYTDGHVGAQDAYLRGLEAFAAQDFATALENFLEAHRKALEVGDEPTELMYDIALCHAALGDAEQCRQWAAYFLHTVGQAASKSAYQLYFYAAENDLGSVDYGALGK